MMAFRKQSLANEGVRLVLVEAGPEPCEAQKMVNFIFRMVISMIAPVRSIQWQMAKRRTRKPASNGADFTHRAIDMAGL
ncbi:MAG TPA: hypothetical protein VFP59_06505 [Candidatus Angelobacter sp.]|nr:hypothetical protein [Candidatus Angelobacter sp.]